MARQELRTSQLTKAKIMLVEAFEDGDSSMSLSIVGSRSVRLLVSLAQSRRHERISEWKSHRDGIGDRQSDRSLLLLRDGFRIRRDDLRSPVLRSS